VPEYLWLDIRGFSLKNSPCEKYSRSLPGRKVCYLTAVMLTLSKRGVKNDAWGRIKNA